MKNSAEEKDAISRAKGSSDRPHKCPECSSSFSRAHDLRRHQRLHSNEKPFECVHCGRAFSRQDALNRHLKTDNPNLPCCGLSQIARKAATVSINTSSMSDGEKSSKDTLSAITPQTSSKQQQHQTGSPSTSISNSLPPFRNSITSVSSPAPVLVPAATTKATVIHDVKILQDRNVYLESRVKELEMNLEEEMKARERLELRIRELDVEKSLLVKLMLDRERNHEDVDTMVLSTNKRGREEDVTVMMDSDSREHKKMAM